MIQSVSIASITVTPVCPNSLTPLFVMGSSSSLPHAYFLYPDQACFMALLTACLLFSLLGSFSMRVSPPLALAATAALNAGCFHCFIRFLLASPATSLSLLVLPLINSSCALMTLSFFIKALFVVFISCFSVSSSTWNRFIFCCIRNLSSNRADRASR